MINKNLKIFFFALGLLITGFVFYFLLSLTIQYILPNSRQAVPSRLHSAYPADKNFYEAAFKFASSTGENKNIIGGIIPHHLLAADLIANLFMQTENNHYDTIVLLGPNHFSAGREDIISSNLGWRTPYGMLEFDHGLLKNLRSNFDIGINKNAIQNEHAVAGEAAFIKKSFSSAKFLPLIFKPGLKMETARELGKKLSESGKNILVLASVDFSHYRDSQTAQADDKTSIQSIKNFEFGNIQNLSLDSPAAISALLAFAQNKNAEFRLLDNSNSALLLDQPDLQSTTSYVTAVFARKQNQAHLPKADDSPNELRMLFFGDIMLDRHVKEKIGQKGMDYIFTNLDKAGFFDNYGLIGANLEGAVTNEGTHYKPDNLYDFAFHPDTVAELKNYNLTFFNLSNNHFTDQGDRGIAETRHNLDKLNFNYSGCRDGVIDECSGRIIDLGNYSLGMIGASNLWGGLDKNKLLSLVEELKNKTDLVIVNIHWGEEYRLKSNAGQQTLARKMIEAGADAIIGHHPHVIQEIEIYQGRPIFYSLGNFIFDQYFSPETQEHLGVELIYKDNNLDFKLHPLKSSLSQLDFMSEEQKQKLLNRIMP